MLAASLLILFEFSLVLKSVESFQCHFDLSILVVLAKKRATHGKLVSGYPKLKQMFNLNKEIDVAFIVKEIKDDSMPQLFSYSVPVVRVQFYQDLSFQRVWDRYLFRFFHLFHSVIYRATHRPRHFLSPVLYNHIEKVEKKTFGKHENVRKRDNREDEGGIEPGRLRPSNPFLMCSAGHFQDLIRQDERTTKKTK